MQTNRRRWLQQTSMAIAGLPFAVNSFAAKNPFVPQEKTIRLSSNENPYGPSPMARKAMTDAVIKSNRYPWDTTTLLREKIAEKYNLTKDNILMGAGSSEILGLTAQYAALQKGNAVTADPSFRIWTNAAQQYGLQVIKIPLTADKKHDLPKMLAAINNDTKLVYVCNPNNPTGTILPHEELKKFVETLSSKTLVLLDEAYLEYTDEPSFAATTAANKNLVIAKTFSKIYGMAGARIGYAIAHADTIQKLKALQPWENAGTSTVSLAGALASLSDIDFVNKTKDLNKKAGDYTIQSLQNLSIETIATNTNFIYFSLADYKKNYTALLNTNNIAGGRIVEETGIWTRITIGTMDEMKQFIKAIG